MEEKDNIDKIIESASHLKVPEGRSKEEAWNLLQKKIESEKPQTKTFRLYPYLSIGIAAALTLLVVAYFFLLSGETISTKRGEHLSVALPDSSAITLNAESEIQYNPRNWEKNRTLKLKGEAFFEVKAGSSFTVETGLGSVEVIGTSFNVNIRENSFEVSCFSGSVHVQDNEENVVVLKAGEFTQLSNNKLTLPAQADEKKTFWRNGEFHFENTPFKNVVAELERQFDLEIEMKIASNRMYTGYFNTKNLEEALQLVFAPMGLHYTAEGKKITVQ
jgi:transmembrane sensor